MGKLVLGFLCVATLFSCQRTSEPYSFFVAGHVYGKPGTKDLGPYKAFKLEFDSLKAREDLAFGVLTGDAVKKCKPVNWDALISGMNELNVDFHLAPGNHDVFNREVFSAYFEKSYYSFKEGNDLHIILDGNLDHWNISGAQLDFLEEAIEKKDRNTKNIFVYSHQVLWFKPEQKPAQIYVNSKEGRGDSTNFDSVVFPLLRSAQIPVFMFAGDVGAGNWASDFAYLTQDNVHMVASGMGDGKNDNYIMVEVDEYSKPTLHLKPLSVDSLNELKPIGAYSKPRR